LTIEYSTLHDPVDWAALKAALAADAFDNGRSPAQMERSFRNSYRAVYAVDHENADGPWVGTGRVLSDGVCNAYIVDMWTQARYRRRGVGREILRRLCEPLTGQHVYLFTDDNEAFYKACGFNVRGAGLEQVMGSWLEQTA